MIKKIESSGQILNYNGDYYNYNRTGETLLVTVNTGSYIQMSNPEGTSTYHCTKAAFDRMIDRKELVKAPFILDYTYTPDGQTWPQRNIIAFPNLKKLSKALNTLGGKIPGENVIFENFLLENKNTGNIIYYGRSLPDMQRAVANLLPAKNVFSPTRMQINKLLSKIGVLHEPPNQLTSTTNSKRR